MIAPPTGITWHAPLLALPAERVTVLREILLEQKSPAASQVEHEVDAGSLLLARGEFCFDFIASRDAIPAGGRRRNGFCLPW